MYTEDQNIVLDSAIQTVVPEYVLAPAVSPSRPQLVYLDFDGAEASYRNRDLTITIDNVMVEPSGFDDEDISVIVASLNEQFGGDVFFIAARPETDDAFSTVYIGVTSAFDKFGAFLGVCSDH